MVKKYIEPIVRTKCLLSQNESIDRVFVFKNFPIFMGCVDREKQNEDLFFDMEWGVSKSGIIQLINLIPLELLYNYHHNPGTIGETWKLHHQRFSEFIGKDNIKKVLEIGGASGKLVEHFIKNDKEFSWTIIEPSTQKSKDSRIRYVEGFFENYYFNEKFDSIIHSHLCEHIYNPHLFFSKINDVLSLGGVQYISIPNMKKWLTDGFLNALNFEHTFYIDENVLEYILEIYNFEVVDKLIDEHSIFVKAVKTDKKINKKYFDFSYIRKIFDSYIDSLINDIKYIISRSNGESVYLFGAHVFSQYILNMGLDENQVISILDNDENKQNKRLYGTNLYVDSPKCIKGLNSPKIIVRAGSYTEEIKKNILEINETTIFI
jgi:2-polyprenyl-3-methyl-5-hydroxy-6-metoxy-1,4-benzoquinol methylase